MADFESRLGELESIVERLEKGELPLEESVRLFEEGMKLSESCKKELDAAEGRIQMLVDQGGGKMKAQPFDLEAEEENEEIFDVEEGEDEE